MTLPTGLVAETNKETNMSNPFTTKDPLLAIINQIVGAKEEVEQIDEISDKTLGNYVAKAVVDVHNDARWAGETDDKDAKNRAFKRLLGVKSAASRLSKQVVPGGRINNFRREEVEQIDEDLGHVTLHHGDRDGHFLQVGPHKDGGHYVHVSGKVKGEKGSLHSTGNITAIRKGEGSAEAGARVKKAVIDAYKTGNKSNILAAVKAHGYSHHDWRLKESVDEEVEQIDESKKTTHEDPLITVHKDGRLHAHAHLSTINDIHGTNVKHTAIHAGGAKVKTKYGDNLEFKLSKWHGVKEEVESLDELSKETLHSYWKKASEDSSDSRNKLSRARKASSISKHLKRFVKRGAGIKTAYGKMFPESVNEVNLDEAYSVRHDGVDDDHPDAQLWHGVKEEVEQFDEAKERGYGETKFKVGQRVVSKAVGTAGHTGVITKLGDKEHEVHFALPGKKQIAHDDLRAERGAELHEISNEEVEQIDEKSEKEVAKDLVALRATVDYHKDVERNWHKYGSFAQPRFRDNPAQLKAAEKGLTKANKDVKKTPVAKFLQTRKGDGKVRTEDVEKAPFEGGREVKSSKSAASRVKKIAKGMQKRFTEKK